MNIQERIKNDANKALIEKDKEKLSFLRVIIGEFNRVDKVVSDEKALNILKRLYENAKQLNNLLEIQILDEYLPKELSDFDLQKFIEQIVTDYNCKSIGEVMKVLKNSGLNYDGKKASNIIKNLL